MDTDSRKEVERILKDGFSDREVMPATEENIFSDECWSVYFEHLAHLAVHVNDKSHRDTMREVVTTHLLCGAPLCAAERAWLIYVIGKVDDTPSESNNGRPIDGYGERLLRGALAVFLIDDEIRNPGTKRGYITARLNRAASTLCKSYESIRKIYYDASFKVYLNRRKERGFNLPGKIRKIGEP
ncbi:MAG: hypothetical protein KA150_03955 [Propionivibrio sp.]|nr:hypothetical protein [Propionivibrio sp.]